jgi:predicted amidophosphoribosyltransferase
MSGYPYRAPYRALRSWEDALERQEETMRDGEPTFCPCCDKPLDPDATDCPNCGFGFGPDEEEDDTKEGSENAC